MHNTSIVEVLDRNIDALLAGAEFSDTGDTELNELLAISRDLRAMPSVAYQQRLLLELSHAGVPQSAMSDAKRLHLMRPNQQPDVQGSILPTLFGEGAGLYRAKTSSYALSVAAHAAVLALILTSGLWMTRHSELAQHVTTTLVTDISTYLPPVSSTEAQGGGGGGDRSKVEAPNGALPRASMQQIAPPMVVRNENAKLQVEPTVVLPPNVKLPQLGPIGDPMSRMSAMSNGTGMGSGIGNGSGGGVGSGSGPGVGAGTGGGIGGGIFHVGGGVSAPRAIYAPDPTYSDEARKARYQGAVQLLVTIDAAGRPRDVKVARSLGMGLDERAVEAVKIWRFEPATRSGHPVAVQINVEVFFHLY